MKRFLVAKSPVRRLLLPRICLLLIVLTWIAAPGAHALSWQPLGAGIGGTRVDQLFVHGDVLVVGGAFSTAGGNPAANIAVWDGSAWSTLADGFDSVLRITEYNGQIVVGGKRPGQTDNRVWTWNGSSWSSPTTEYHHNLTGFQSYLYGTSTFNYGPTGTYVGTRIHRFDGTAWSLYSTITWDEFYVTQDMQVLGGQLRMLMSYGGNALSFDGSSWSVYPSSGYFPGTLGLWNGALIAAGNEMGAVPYVKEWTGSGWVNHMTYAGGWGEFCAGVAAVVEHEGQLVVGGVFGGGFDCGVPGQSVVSFDGTSWAAVGADMNNRVSDLIVYDGTLIAAGDFTMSGSVTTSLIAQYTDAPVPVAISQFSAHRVDGGVELSWEISADEPFDGFHIYRTLDGRTERATPTLLAASDRRFVDQNVVAGHRYVYELVLAGAGSGDIRSAPVAIELPDFVTTLHQNVPNPFNPVTAIRYTLAEPGHVALAVYAPDGRAVRTLVNGHRTAGNWTTRWDGTDDRGTVVPAGVYFCRLQSGKTSISTKMVLIK